MTETKPIIRTEDLGDKLRVVTQRQKDLVGGLGSARQNILTREYEDFFTVRGHNTDETQYIRVGTAVQRDGSEGWQIHGANGIYAQVPLTERSLSEAEQNWSQSNNSFQGTESVVEFTIPHPESLRRAILEQEFDRLDCLDAVIKDHESRHKVFKNLQERIAEWKVRKNQLDPNRGLAADLEGKWNPATNEDYTKKQLYEMASERYSAHIVDWQDVTGFSYLSFHNARSRLIDTDKFNPYPIDLCPLHIAGYPGWTYCQICGAVGPPSEFSPKKVDWAEEPVRSCEQCFETEWPDV